MIKKYYKQKKQTWKSKNRFIFISFFSTILEAWIVSLHLNDLKDEKTNNFLYLHNYFVGFVVLS